MENQPVRFAILGAADIARKVAPSLHASNVSVLSGVASRSREKARRFAAEYQIPQTYGSYQEALDDPAIDAVYIPLPPSLHRQWTVRAAEAGKHVLCEKPVARNAAELDEMFAACRQHDVVFLDGVMWYHTRRFAEMAQLFRSETLGTIRSVNSAATLNWKTMPLDEFRMQRAMGGGALLDVGWYCVGAALVAMNRLPQQVFARARWHNDVDIHLNGILWFDEGQAAMIECGFDTLRRRWMEVAGTKHGVVCDGFTRPWNEDAPRYWVNDNNGISTEHVAPNRPQEECMVDAFCQLIRDGRIDHDWLPLSRNTQLVCEMLDRSARTETVVNF